VSADWRVVEYVDARGASPVRVFLAQLEAAERARLWKRVQYVKKEGLRAGPEVMKKLHGPRGHPRRKLWELRLPRSRHNPRILCYAAPGRRIVLLHGFAKVGAVSDAVPEAEVALALRRMRDHQERST